MLLRLSPPTRSPRNALYAPGRDVRLSYASIELDPIDYPLGTTLVSALLVIEAGFGLNPLVTKQIGTAPSASGQITDDAADGTGAMSFALTPTESTDLATAPVVFEVLVTDSLGRQARLDIGSLVPTDSTVGNPVNRVVVAPDAFSLQDPNTEQLTVTAYDADGNVLLGRAVNWTSSNPAAAPIDPVTGVVTGVGFGSVLFTATIEGQSDTSTGTIITNVATITVTPNPETAVVGDSVQMTAVARDAGGAIVGGQAFVWDTDNHAIATVDQAGMVTFVAQGTCNVTASVSTITGSAVATAQAPAVLTFEHWPVEDGNFPRTLPAGCYFYHRGGSWLQYDEGNGVIRRASLLAPAFMAGPPDDIRGSQLSYDNPGGTSWSVAAVDAGAAPSAAVLPTQPLRWLHFKVGSAFQGWESITGELFVQIPELTLLADNPDQLFAQVYIDSRTTPGLNLTFYLSRKFGPALATTTITTNGTEQKVEFTAPITWSAGELSGGVDLSVVMYFTTPPASGNDLYIANHSVSIGEIRPLKYNALPVHTGDFQSQPSAMAIHLARGLHNAIAAQNAIPAPGDVGQGSQWAGTGSVGWTTTDSGTLGPDGRLVPVGNVNRNWKRQVVAAGGVQVATGLALVQDGTAGPNVDSPVNSAAGRRVRIHFYWQKDGANALPIAGDLQFEMVDSIGTKTGLLSTPLPDETNPNFVTAWAQITIDPANTATTFTARLRNVSGHGLQFLEARRNIEREGWSGGGTRNNVIPDALVTPQRPRVTHEANPIIKDIAQPRVESPNLLVTLSSFFVYERVWQDWEIPDLAASPNEVWRKLNDTGPQASSYATFLGSYHRNAGGGVEWQSIITDSPNVGGVNHLLEIPLPTNILVKRQFQDKAWMGTNGRVTDVYINGVWFYRDVNGKWWQKNVDGTLTDITATVNDSYTAGTLWTIGTGFYYLMDRDFDLAYNGNLRAIGTKTGTNPTHAQVEGIFRNLTRHGVGSRPGT